MTVTIPEVRPEAPAEPVYPDLLEVADVLRRHGWAQEDFEVFDVESDRRVGFCTLGAYYFFLFGEIPDDEETLSGIEAKADEFARRLGFDSEDPGSALVGWNDEEDRTPEEVIERIERAAYGL